MQSLTQKITAFFYSYKNSKMTIPWFGLVAIFLMIQGLGYLGANAMLISDAVLVNWINVQTVLLPFLMIVKPVWQAASGITIYPMLVLLGMPAVVTLLFYIEGSRHVK